MPKTEITGCALSRLLRILGTEWTGVIIQLLGEKGEFRHTHLKDSLGQISAKVLTERLRLLEDEGFVYRKEEEEGPRKVSYGLTEKGQDLHTILTDFTTCMQRWASGTSR